MHQKFNFINNHLSLLIMSSQPISNILSSIIARFKQLQNKTESNSSVQSPLNNQPEYSRHCVNTPQSEAAESSTAGDWWARLHRGLVIDSSAKHYRQMKQAVWLYLYFLLNANWKTGRLYRRLSTISQDTGINLFAIRRWLRVLQRNGYINACYNGHYWVIAINKWKPLKSLLTPKRGESRARTFKTFRLRNNDTRNG
jgi:hypothetical protein